MPRFHDEIKGPVKSLNLNDIGSKEKQLQTFKITVFNVVYKG